MKTINAQSRNPVSAAIAAAGSGHGLVLSFPKEFQRNWIQSLDRRFLSIFFACFFGLYAFVVYKNFQPAPEVSAFDPDRLVRNIVPAPQIEIYNAINQDIEKKSNGEKVGGQSVNLSAEAKREIRKNQALRNSLIKRASLDDLALDKGVMGVLTSGNVTNGSKYANVNFNNNKKTDFDGIINGMNGLITAESNDEKTAIGSGERITGTKKGLSGLTEILPGQEIVNLNSSVGGALVGAARVNITDNAASAGRSGTDIQNVVNSGLAAITNCFEKQLKRKPTLRGKLSVQILITKNGSVRSVKVLSNTLGDQAVATCIAGRIKSWRFPAAKGKGKGQTTVSQTFVFGS